MTVTLHDPAVSPPSTSSPPSPLSPLSPSSGNNWWCNACGISNAGQTCTQCGARRPPPRALASLKPGEAYVSILDDTPWPAVTVQRRWLSVGLRSDVARLFCEWHERWLVAEADGDPAAYVAYDPRDVESDHVYYVDGPAGPAGSVVYRLVWNPDATADRTDGTFDYDLIIETADADGRLWIGEGDWLWQYTDAD